MADKNTVLSGIFVDWRETLPVYFSLYSVFLIIWVL